MSFFLVENTQQWDLVLHLSTKLEILNIIIVRRKIPVTFPQTCAKFNKKYRQINDIKGRNRVKGFQTPQPLNSLQVHPENA